MLWATDLVSGASLLGAVVLLVTGDWAFVTFRTYSMPKAHLGTPTRLARPAALDRVAAPITAVILTGVVLVLAWRLRMHPSG